MGLAIRAINKLSRRSHVAMAKAGGAMKCRVVKVFQDRIDQAAIRTSRDGFAREMRTQGERDVCAPDGVVYYGHRTISRSGSFRFARLTWQHDILVPLAGLRVGVRAQDYYLC